MQIEQSDSDTLVFKGDAGEYARPARQVIAIDRDTAALERLSARLLDRGLAEKFTLVASDLLEARPCGDVLLFEFCLHEMAEPERALAHARELAPDLLVIDHAPGSRWAWYAAEEGGLEGRRAKGDPPAANHRGVAAFP